MLSIIVPCYNEEKNLAKNIESARKLVEQFDIQIIFVENGSSDRSKTIFMSCESTLPKNIQILYLSENKGYGYGIKSAFSQCHGLYIGWTHGDGQTNIHDVEQVFCLMDLANTDYGIIKGRRINRPISSKIISKGLELLASFLFGVKLSEINAQPSIYKAELLYSIKNDLSNDLLLDLDCYLMAKKRSYEEIRFDVSFPERMFGASSWNKGAWSIITHSVKNIKHLIVLKYKFSLNICKRNQAD